METLCYCCDKPAVGQGDHVPPRALFTSGTFAFKAPIIVPSCIEHNENKSMADEYLKLVLTSSAAAVPDDVRGGTVRSVLRHVKNPHTSLDRFGMERTEEGIRIGAAAPLDSELLDDALGKVARGIYYHHHRGLKKLIGKVVVLPIFLGIEPDAPADVRAQLESLADSTAENLKIIPVQGEHQDVFGYQVIDCSEFVTVNMVFYGTKIASVIQPRLG